MKIDTVSSKYLNGFFSLGFIFLVSLAPTACGASPLLHHLDELDPSEARAAESQTSGNAGECQLNWSLPTGRVCGNFEWAAPPKKGDNTITVRFKSAIKFEDFAFYADMPHMGHGTDPVRLEKISDTEIVIHELWLSMNGEWILHFVLGGVESNVSLRLK